MGCIAAGPLRKRGNGTDIIYPGARDRCMRRAKDQHGQAGAVRYSPPAQACEANEGKTMIRAAIFVLLVMAAGCTDLKPLQAQIEDLQEQVSKLQANLAQSASNATAANRTTAASAAAASGDAKQALSVGQANTAAIEALNTKIDQMFRKRPTE
jgi:uncharacterized protein HemX